MVAEAFKLALCTLVLGITLVVSASVAKSTGGFSVPWRQNGGLSVH